MEPNPSLSTLENIPVVAREQDTCPFRFYHEGQVSEGMRYKNDLYHLLHTFDLSSRFKAYNLGCQLLADGQPIIITVSQDSYKIWLNLRFSKQPQRRTSHDLLAS